jgi:hypothetical protein
MKTIPGPKFANFPHEQWSTSIPKLVTKITWNNYLLGSGNSGRNQCLLQQDNKNQLRLQQEDNLQQ